MERDDLYSILSARIDDFIKASQKGELACSNFLNPKEIYFAQKILNNKQIHKLQGFFGGYEDAQRKRLFILPEFLADYDDTTTNENFQMYYEDEYKSFIKPLKIQGSTYRNLTHSDYMGAILSLGIEREGIGDIVLQDSFCAVVFCTQAIFDFLILTLDKVANDKVIVSGFDVTENFICIKSFEDISSTISSSRLDCVVGALCKVSREKSQELIKAGLCELNYETQGKYDKTVDMGSTISVRGYGKFEICSIGDMTKKGRLRMQAKKYN